MFLTPGKDELALKVRGCCAVRVKSEWTLIHAQLNFSSIDITAPDNSPDKVSVEKLHKVGLLPVIFQQDVQEAFGISTSNLNHSGSTYLLECTPEWFTYEQMCVLGRHPLVIDVEITSRALYIQFVQNKTDSASSLRTCRRSGDSKSIASSA